MTLQDEPGKWVPEPVDPFCLEKNEDGIFQQIRNDQMCDGVSDCPDGEDEDGRLAICGKPVTENGCCAEIDVNWSGSKCFVDGTHNGRDRYQCMEFSEFRWEPCCGWFFTDYAGNWGYFAMGNAETQERVK